MTNRIVRGDLTLEGRVNLIKEVLRDVYDEEGVEIVMRSRNTLLRHQSPLSLLEKGHFSYVYDWATRLVEGPM